MNRFHARVALILLAMILLPYRSPAPLIYRPGEGWTYETPGSKKDWHREVARDQLGIAQQAFDKRQYGLALKAAKRVIQTWPLSDYAPQAQYLIGRCYEAKKQDEKAFNAYQTMLTMPTYQSMVGKNPNTEKMTEVQQRQFAIALRFLHGQWFKLFGYVPFFPNMDKTADMFESIVRFGPYGELGPPSQMNIGAAREKEKDYPLAVKAYERAADRYADQPKVASDAQFKEGMAYYKQARKADYDQSIAGEAIATFTDFMALYPDDPRVADSQKNIAGLKQEQALGNFHIAQFYEKRKKWDGALVYYNEVLLSDAGSPLAAQARHRIEILKDRATRARKTPPPAPASSVPAAPTSGTAPAK